MQDEPLAGEPNQAHQPSEPILDRLFVSGTPVRTQRVCEFIVEIMPVDGAAIVLVGSGGTRERVHATDTIAQYLDELQFTLGEGPCVQAYEQASPVLVPDLTRAVSQVDWPNFAQQAVEVGARAVFAFPMSVGSVQFGVMELYRRDVGDLTGEQLSLVALLVRAAVQVVLQELDAVGPDDGADTLFATRPEVHQASGMIAIQLGVTVAEALSRLRAAAYAQNRTAVQVAIDVLARRTDFRDFE